MCSRVLQQRQGQMARLSCVEWRLCPWCCLRPPALKGLCWHSRVPVAHVRFSVRLTVYMSPVGCRMRPDMCLTALDVLCFGWAGIE